MNAENCRLWVNDVRAERSMSFIKKYSAFTAFSAVNLRVWPSIYLSFGGWKQRADFVAQSDHSISHGRAKVRHGSRHLAPASYAFNPSFMTQPSSDPQMESVRIRLLKVLRLAQQGVGGERENAEALLEKLLRKHSMTMADLEGTGESAQTRVWLTASDAEERIVLSQLAIRLFGTQRKLWTQQGRFDVGVDLSASEKAAIEIAWEVYREAFAEARHALVLGFCFKHDLYAAEDTAAEMSDEERERGRRAMALADVLPRVESPGHRLGSG